MSLESGVRLIHTNKNLYLSASPFKSLTGGTGKPPNVYYRQGIGFLYINHVICNVAIRILHSTEEY